MNRLAVSLTVMLAVAGATLAAAPEGASDPETAAAARRLMEVLRVEQQMGPVLEQVGKMQSTMIEQQALSEEQKATARELMAASMEEVEKALSWENLEKVMVGAYASVFTRQEIDDLTAFFETPAGQRFVEKQPELQAAMMREMGGIMAELMPKIQQKTREVIERVLNQAAED